MINNKELQMFVELVYRMSKEQRSQASCFMQGIVKRGFHNNKLIKMEDLKDV